MTDHPVSSPEATTPASDRDKLADALRAVFSGDDYAENAANAAGEGEWSWFGWLASTAGVDAVFAVLASSPPASDEPEATSTAPDTESEAVGRFLCHVRGCVRHYEGMHVDAAGDAIVHVGCSACVGGVYSTLWQPDPTPAVSETACTKCTLDCDEEAGCRRTPAGGAPEIEDLIERSSLGTPEAKAARATVSDERAARVVARAHELDRDDGGDDHV